MLARLATRGGLARGAGLSSIARGGRSALLLCADRPAPAGRLPLCSLAPAAEAPAAPPAPPPPEPPAPSTPPATPAPPAPEPPSRFAIFELGGAQYKVAADDVICVEKLTLGNAPVDVGSIIEAPRVLLVGSQTTTVIGSPLVKDACVRATVEEQTLAEKVIVFKKKRRKGYKRWKGSRSPLTVLRINSIDLPPGLDEALADR